MFKFKHFILIVSVLVAVLLLLKGQQGFPVMASLLTHDDRQSTDDAPVVLHADQEGHFFGDMMVNGVLLEYIVDTAAGNLTLSSHDAEKAHIDYKSGVVVSLITTGGEVLAFNLKLQGVKIGDAVLDDVVATVIEGAYPPYVLLGASAQQKLDVKRDNAVMKLGKKR